MKPVARTRGVTVSYQATSMAVANVSHVHTNRRAHMQTDNDSFCKKTSFDRYRVFLSSTKVNNACKSKCKSIRDRFWQKSNGLRWKGRNGNRLGSSVVLTRRELMWQSRKCKWPNVCRLRLLFRGRAHTRSIRSFEPKCVARLEWKQSSFVCEAIYWLE